MRVDFLNAFKLSILVTMVIAFIVMIPSIIIISSELLDFGRTTLAKVTEEAQKQEIRVLAIKEDSSAELIKSPKEKVVVGELSLSLIFDHVLGDYTKDELREQGNSYTPSQWFKQAIVHSLKDRLLNKPVELLQKISCDYYEVTCGHTSFLENKDEVLNVIFGGLK